MNLQDYTLRTALEKELGFEIAIHKGTAWPRSFDPETHQNKPRDLIEQELHTLAARTGLDIIPGGYVRFALQ